MANLSIEMPDDLARSLEGIAAAQRKSIQQLALERLISFVEDVPEYRAGSPTAVLRAMQEGPHPTAADVEELDALIAAGRLPIRERDLFFGLIPVHLSSRYERGQRSDAGGLAHGVLAFVNRTG